MTNPPPAHGSASNELKQILKQFPVIPALRKEADLPRATQSASQLVYLLNASLSNLDAYLQVLRSAGKEVIVNLDLCAGLARDTEAVSYLASSGIAGVISTHVDVLGAASSRGLYSIQRTFMIDSGSVTSTLRSLKRFEPDALELLPALVAPRILGELRGKYSNIATIGGGLIADLREAESLIQQGLDAVSVGNPALWAI